MGAVVRLRLQHRASLASRPVLCRCPRMLSVATLTLGTAAQSMAGLPNLAEAAMTMNRGSRRPRPRRNFRALFQCVRRGKPLLTPSAHARVHDGRGWSKQGQGGANTCAGGGRFDHGPGCRCRFGRPRLRRRGSLWWDGNRLRPARNGQANERDECQRRQVLVHDFSLLCTGTRQSATPSPLPDGASLAQRTLRPFIGPTGGRRANRTPSLLPLPLTIDRDCRAVTLRGGSARARQRHLNVRETASRAACRFALGPAQ
jgi:hypothetical protein